MTKSALSILILIIFVWFVAQTIKLILAAAYRKGASVRMYFSTGNMPSSHSAVVSVTTTSLALLYGIDSPAFVVSFLFSMIVIHDAVQVRGALGRSTQVMKTFLGDIIEAEFRRRADSLAALEKQANLNPGAETDAVLKKIHRMTKEINDLKTIKVVLGHTIAEVVVGALAGALIAFIYYFFVHRYIPALH